MTLPDQEESKERAGKILFFLFLLTLPLVNPWVWGDGVGYSAYVWSAISSGIYGAWGFT